MTCEMAIMNRRAVVRAADSAATITSWVDGTRQSRFLKGANKIFQVSEQHPVGLMIFATADLGSVPWELIVKHFRRTIATTSFADLAGYGQSLFAYVEGATDLFPQAERDRLFVRAARDTGFSVAFDLAADATVTGAHDEPAKLAALKQLIDRRSSELDSQPVSAPFKSSDLGDSLHHCLNAVAVALQPLSEALSFLDAAAFQPLASLAINCLLKRFDQYKGRLDSTGIVIAGYGDNSFFPSVIQYRCHGLLLDKCVHSIESESSISSDNVSEVRKRSSNWNRSRKKLLGLRNLSVARSMSPPSASTTDLYGSSANTISILS